ncbi:MAG: cobalt-precorrin 5A hydrolase [Anaerovoracaceae bacterium]
MKAGIVYFTSQGEKLSRKVKTILEAIGYNVEVRNKNEVLKEWTKKSFVEKRLIIFISATGIAVRTIAPFLVSKTEDPAVLVIDDGGDFVISLVSGHIGGGNKMTKEISKKIGATPVVTTSTDVNNKLPIDQWAMENNLAIGDMEMAKKFAMYLLEGRRIGLVSKIDLGDNIPKDFILTDQTDLGVNISWKRESVFTRELKLIPRRIVLGIGCKKDTPKKTIEDVVLAKLFAEDINLAAVAKIGTIDLKKDEEGLIEFAKDLNSELMFFTSQQLEEAKGEFPPSDFVKEITGTDNVCQRAASLLSHNGEILFEKFSKDGVTVSAALIK